jgi:CRISPR/Cas system endoribonuclease Cas6 (RAMP superfamily)
MTLNGLTGRLWLRGLPRIFGDLLWLGQWTHVGKNATFGLGRYLLEKEN